MKAAEVISAVAREMDLSPRRIVGPERWTEYMAARREVARRLREAGWSYPRIGRALRRNQATIFGLLHPRKAAA